MAALTYTVIFKPAEEGGFVATCPALPGLVTEGDTLDEARAMAKDAIQACLQTLRIDRIPFPADKTPVQEEVSVTFAEPV